MNNNILLPFELINKILIMRPSHPIVTILRKYIKDRNIENGNETNIIYCDHVYYLLQNNDCFMMEDFNYKYKSYRKCYNKVIKRLNMEIDKYNFYKSLCIDNNYNSNEYSFKTFEKCPIYADFWNYFN